MQLAKSVKFRREKFGAVLFHTETERVFTLNPAAASVMEEIRTGHDEAAIVASLKTRFTDPVGRIERDVHGLLDDLKDKGLVTADPR